MKTLHYSFLEEFGEVVVRSNPLALLAGLVIAAVVFPFVLSVGLGMYVYAELTEGWKGACEGFAELRDKVKKGDIF